MFFEDERVFIVNILCFEKMPLSQIEPEDRRTWERLYAKDPRDGLHDLIVSEPAIMRSGRRSRPVERLVDTMGPRSRLRVEREALFYGPDGLGLSKQRQSYTRPLGSTAPRSEIEDYIAYDPVTHHVLVQYKNHDTDSDELICEWYPDIALKINYLEMQPGPELNIILLDLRQKIEHFRNEPQMLNAKLQGLEKKSIIDFRCKFASRKPFVGYIPKITDAKHVYSGKEMIVFEAMSDDSQYRDITRGYGMTDLDSLTTALQQRIQKSNEDAYAEHVLEALITFVDKSRRQIDDDILRDYFTDFNRAEHEKIYAPGTAEYKKIVHDLGEIMGKEYTLEVTDDERHSISDARIHTYLAIQRSAPRWANGKDATAYLRRTAS